MALTLSLPESEATYLPPSPKLSISYFSTLFCWGDFLLRKGDVQKKGVIGKGQYLSSLVK